MIIEGLDELEKQFDKLEKTAKKKVINKALTAGVAPIKKEAKKNAPVDKGILKSAIRSKKLKKTEKPSIGVYVTGKGYYWWFIEHGTSKMSAAPFLRPAADAKHREGVEKIKLKLKAEIDKITDG